MCGAGYHSDDIKFLGQIDNHCFMQLNCHGCSVPVLATVFLNESGGADIIKKPRQKRSFTDLKPREKTHFIAKGSIESTEIADFHLFLTTYEGNLTHLNSR